MIEIEEININDINRCVSLNLSKIYAVKIADTPNEIDFTVNINAMVALSTFN